MKTAPVNFGFIPARYQSKRFPGKPLADICGKPMIWHVYHRAMQCPHLDRVTLATDDERIQTAVISLNIPVIMTRRDHPTGTDRILEAAEILEVPNEAVVVNIQADEPLLDPETITQLLLKFADPSIQVATPVAQLNPAQAQDPNVVKVVIDNGDCALYFSRAPIPYSFDKPNVPFYGHIGVYAFQMQALKAFGRFGPCHLETIEKLEQLRFLVNHIPIHVVKTTQQDSGINRPADLKRVSAIIRSRI